MFSFSFLVLCRNLCREKRPSGRRQQGDEMHKRNLQQGDEMHKRNVLAAELQEPEL